MQHQGYEPGPGTELEHYDAEDAPTRQHRSSERDLSRYEDDEVATAPWPPQLS